MPTTTARRPKRKVSPGRPSEKHILRTYKKLLVYLAPEMLDGIDRQAEKERRASGVVTSRVDIIRKAVAQYLASQQEARYDR